MRNQSQAENKIETRIRWLEVEHVRLNEFKFRVFDLRSENVLCALQHRRRNIDDGRVIKFARL